MPIPHLPALIIGLIVAFYWGRVIKMVIKTKLQTGRSANFFPPETLGRILRVIWYPNVVAWVVIPLLSSLYPGWRLWSVPGLEWVAVAIALVAMYYTLVCWRKMGRAWRMGIDPNEKNKLIISGPYALVRHPIYALQCLLALVSFVAVPNVWMAVIASLQILLLQWEARREEKHMLSVHGETYAHYMRMVGRFIPRGRYAPPAGV